ncbi:MAG TPA: Holliday junction resolvase RuvX [Burkholderiales bacterium]
MHERSGTSMSDLPVSPPPSSSVAGTVLAFDFGLRHLGVAVGEASLGFAHPLTSIDAEANDIRFAEIAKLVAQWQPTLLVLGLPLNMDGSEHEFTRRARRFGRQLEGRFGVSVAFVDERLTSVEAESQLRDIGHGGRAHKSLSHTIAAQIILQNYFDDYLAA